MEYVCSDLACEGVLFVMKGMYMLSRLRGCLVYGKMGVYLQSGARDQGNERKATMDNEEAGCYCQSRVNVAKFMCFA